MKQTLLFCIILLCCCTIQAQVGIGTANPASSSVLDLTSMTKGFLPPRMTQIQRNAIVSPVRGLQVYCLDCVPDGPYHFNGTTWMQVGGAVATPVIASVCNGFVTGSYISGIATTGTYTVTLTNNSFSTATIGLGVTDLALSGVSGSLAVTGVSIAGVAVTSVNLIAGAAATVTYTITGTPSVTGTLTGAWTKLSLNCSATKAVTGMSSLFASSYCTGASLTGSYVSGIAVSGATYTVTLTNTSGAVTPTLPAPVVGNLVLSGVGGVSVFSVFPNTAFTIANGGMQTITYTLTGTPLGAGTLSAAWIYGDLTCTKTKSVTLGDANFTLPQTATVVSILDGIPVVDIQGVVDNAANKKTILLAYTGGLGSYAAYASAWIPSGSGTGESEDSNNFRISYPAGIFASSGNIEVTYEVGDDGTFNAKKKSFGSQEIIATLPLDVNGVNKGNMLLDVIGGIPDRRFGQTTTQGGVAGTYHNTIYLPITSTTGKVWLNNNLGADYNNMSKPSFNPSQQGTSSTDHRAYGSLYQWGRLSDGHELINWSSATAGTPVNGSTGTLSGTDTPGSNLFITNG
jgi:hypothetical protein